MNENKWKSCAVNLFKWINYGSPNLTLDQSSDLCKAIGKYYELMEEDENKKQVEKKTTRS